MASPLDDVAEMVYNAYMERYMSGVKNDKANRQDEGEINPFVDWIRKMFKAQYQTETVKIKALDETQKDVQRSIWQIGAQNI